MEKLQTTCDGLLFNTDLPVTFESGQSSFSIEKDATDALVMETGIGQGKTLVSPLHMLLLVSAVDNGGVLMTPYLLDSVESSDGETVRTYEPSQNRTLFTADEAAFLAEYMRAVVTDGTGSKLDTDDYTAFGKTGTAQVSDSTNETNAWFVGYAQADGCEDIAIAVIVEGGESGSRSAVPVAKKVFEAYFE
jgi:peptidoglycan glycosyltransferase